MTSFAEIDRKKEREEAEKRSKHNDMKQHADKLIQGFQKLSDSHAKRAIWELFQNAIDLSEHAEITIQLTDDSLIFQHNGKHFDDNTLNCLIKQVSSKSGDTNDDEIGQYGTGFITTHSFGRKILLSGSLAQNNHFISLDDFVIDRTPKNSNELIQELIKQQDKVFELIEKGVYVKEAAQLTKFAYLTETDLQATYAQEAIDSIPLILPYVMTLNDRLKKVTVIDRTGQHTQYHKGEEKGVNDMVETQISINDKPYTVYSLQDNDKNVAIVLPIENGNRAIKFSEKLSRLFLFYPLIGTEQFGMNFLIHAKHFSPTEQRDGVYLKSKTEQIQENEKSNREIINKASLKIFGFLEDHAETIVNPINLAKINFPILSDKPLLNEYFNGLKSDWIDKFKNLKLVESGLVRITPSEAVFISAELLASEKAYDAIYNLVSKFWSMIPNKALAKEWTEIIVEWGDSSIAFISRTDLVQKIQDAGNLSIFTDKQDLIIFYQSIIDLEHTGLFNDFKLLPNLKGEFRNFSSLNQHLNLSQILLEIADVIMPDVPKRHVHEEFKFSLPFTPYTRENYSSDINEHLSKSVKEKFSSQDISPQFLQTFIRYCKLVSNRNSDSVPSKLMRLISGYYRQGTELIEVSDLNKDELDIRPPQKRLLRLFLIDVGKESSTWVEENLSFLKDVIMLGSNYHDFEDLYHTLPIYPSQLNEIASQSSLSPEEEIPSEIKDLYDLVVRPDKPIRSTLVHPDFAICLKGKEKKSVRSLTEKIETIFSEDGQYADVGDHRFINEILYIIQNISNNPEWGQYFPLLNSKRANIMLARVTDERIKEDVFSIVTLEAAKINKLGELARNPDIEEIIKLGEEKLEEKKRAEEEFEFKKKIGTHIEGLVRARIGKDIKDFRVAVVDQQGGQDMVILMKEKIVYYIEVKSRWDSKNSIRMSYSQCNKAVEHKERFSLCAVDLVDYHPKDGSDRHLVDDITKIIDKIKFVNDIGYKIEPLITADIRVKTKEDEVRLSDDYRAIVPQPLINKSGITLSDFVTQLISIIKK